MTINWPAAIHYQNDVELTLLYDQNDWEREAQLYRYNGDSKDRIIDSSGNIFHVIANKNKNIFVAASKESIGLNEFLGLIKAHAAEKESCCIAKLYAPSFPDAFKILASLSDT